MHIGKEDSQYNKFPLVKDINRLFYRLDTSEIDFTAF